MEEKRKYFSKCKYFLILVNSVPRESFTSVRQTPVIYRKGRQRLRSRYRGN